ncbi:uncharacterized protein LOC125652665 [Ostrea edulis]|uniref:uncharacterized protein LOC125652665 n=1 Tax=Ostrea edulis TaxID=37623 RepID=UPI0024AF6E7B|nr:uncharacterized protein LOC125652665 [Ostrea edulis]
MEFDLYTFFIFYLLMIYSNGKKVHSQQKRILLNDPDLINSRLEAMERELQAVRSDLTDTKTETQVLKHLVDSQTTELRRLKTSGTTYIRWGRKSCPALNGTSLLYSGFAASGFYDAKAASTNTLCLPHDPDTAPVGLPVYADYGRIYGSEYEFNFKNIALNDDVPCAVCYTTQAVSIMIPAKTSCPSSWTKQYAGFLTSGGYYSDQYGNEYLCVDGDPEYMTDGARRHNENGRLFYPVHSVCGSLPCPPYKDSQNLGCVVCTN